MTSFPMTHTVKSSIGIKLGFRISNEPKEKEKEKDILTSTKAQN